MLGFKYLESNRNQISKFGIHRSEYNQLEPYPISHTCFNRLVLPSYPTYSVLKEKVTTVVNEELNFFGLE